MVLDDVPYPRRRKSAGAAEQLPGAKPSAVQPASSARGLGAVLLPAGSAQVRTRCPPLQHGEESHSSTGHTHINFPLPSMKLVLGAAGCSMPGMQTRQWESSWTVQGEGKHANVCSLNYCCVFLTAQQGTASPAHSLVPWQALKPVTFSPVLSCYLINESSGGKGF